MIEEQAGCRRSEAFRKQGDVLGFYKLHEDKSERVGNGKQNERGEWIYQYLVDAKERPGIVVSVESNGDVFLWMAGSGGRLLFETTDGQRFFADHRPRNFRTCPERLINRKMGRLNPLALVSLLDKISLEGMGWNPKLRY